MSAATETPPCRDHNDDVPCGTYYSARMMALRSHNLSRDGMSAVDLYGDTWRWSEHFKVWVCMEKRAA